MQLERRKKRVSERDNCIKNVIGRYLSILWSQIALPMHQYPKTNCNYKTDNFPPIVTMWSNYLLTICR